MTLYIGIKIFKLLIYFNICNLCFSHKEFNISIEEETALNSVLIDFQQKFPNNYSAFDLDDFFFSVTQDGKLKVKSNIDLDTMCINHQKCCGDFQCFLSFTVFYKKRLDEVDELLKINVMIKDINDNLPNFKTQSQKLSISEFAGINKRISLIPAEDLDFEKKNQIRNYTFFEASKTFDLDQSNVGSPALIISNSLDFEKRKEYNAEWAACDFNSRCAKQRIIIDIVDENDNSPKFLENKLSVRIPEDFQVGKVVIKLNATDKDSSPYNSVKYGFWEASSDRNIKQTFIVTENTGELRLKEKLNTRIRTYYKFKIFAEDAYGLNMEKDFIEIEINIDDVNDHAPKIDLVSTRLPIFIRENSKPGFVLSIKVSDNDFGINANVSCVLNSNNQDFSLEHSTDQLYTVRSKRSFNYEQEKSISLTINCIDAGLTPKADRKTIEIKIIDENEFSPEFSETVYQQEILENKLEGQHVLNVHALDRDGSASLIYSLDETVQGFFTIEKFTGEIRTGSKIIDREDIEKFQFNVSVCDSNVNPNIGKAAVIVIIIDENDNAPQFITHFPNARYSMIENSALMTPIGQQIEATDKDKSDLNSKLQFSIARIFDFNLRELYEQYFTISNRGTISNIKLIDREINPNFTLTIKVHDNGNPPLSSKMNITLLIEDQNDNSPIFLTSMQDPEQQVMINISSEKSTDSILTWLKATDNDIGRNGEIYYSLSGEIDNILKINSSSGEIKLLRKMFHGSYKFIVHAYDGGSPQRLSRINLILNVYGDDMNMLNSTIIILLLTITGIISLFLIIAITCVRRRPRSIPSFTPNGSDILKGMQNGSPIKYKQNMNNTAIYYPSNFDVINIGKSGNMPMESLERDVLISSNILPCNPNIYSEFAMVPSYFSSTVNMGRLTPTFRSNERDDDSADSGKGGSEDEVGLANLQLGQYSLDHLEIGNKSHGCSSSSPNTRSLNFHRYNYRSRNPSTFHVVPEDESVQNNFDCNTILNKMGNLPIGNLNQAQNSLGQSYSCINSRMYMPLMSNSYGTCTSSNGQTSTVIDSVTKTQDQINYHSASSIQMRFDES